MRPRWCPGDRTAAGPLGLVQRVLEASGIPAVSLSMIPELTRGVVDRGLRLQGQTAERKRSKDDGRGTP